MFFLSPLRWALRLPSLLLLSAVGYVVASGVQVVTASRQQVAAVSAAKAAAIVVLPAPLQPGGAPSPDLLGRLETAERLVAGKATPRVVVAGLPAAPGDPSPGAVAARWLVDHGVPRAKVLRLSTSTPTATLAAVAAVVGTPARIVVVTDAMDALFSRGAASADGLTASVAPAVGSTSISVSDLGPLWRQATGVAVGRVIGYAHATWADH
ncbi:MAG: YdcF family protein [Actinomycetota bacterium]|nr:YdcF family protein [Actinomycetota bacterium]